MNEYYKSTAAAVIAFLSPLPVSLNEGPPQSRRNVLTPFQIEEVLMKLIFEELRALGATVTVINSEPFSIFLQVYCNLVFIALPVEALMSNSSIGL